MPTQVATAAETIQEWVFDELWSAGKSTAWPECPDHPDSHPLSPKVIASKAVWCRPRTAAVAAKIDRVSRSTTDFARLLDQAEKKGWKLVVLDADVETTTAAGRLLVDVVSAAASFESRRIGERAKSVPGAGRAGPLAP